MEVAESFTNFAKMWKNKNKSEYFVTIFLFFLKKSPNFPLLKWTKIIPYTFLKGLQSKESP
jgi:hypothetical protein